MWSGIWKRKILQRMVPEDALPETAAALHGHRCKEMNKNDAGNSSSLRHDGVGYVGLLDSEGPGKRHSRFTYLDTSETREKQKQDVNVFMLMLLFQISCYSRRYLLQL